MRGFRVAGILVTLCISAGSVAAQSPSTLPASEVINRPITAIGYTVNGGTTKVGLRDTGALPGAGGEAKVQAKPGITNVDVSITGLTSPLKLGTEFLTFVLWAVSPDGRATNLGEVIPDKSGSANLKVTTQLQTFSLFLTAEPYFGVRQPSELIILENQQLKDTKGKVFIVNDYPLMRRNQYQKLGNPLALSLDLKNVPLSVYEARNAVDIARSRGAGKDAPEVFTKAEASLQMTENALAAKKNKKDIESLARQTVQFAEDSRALAAQRQEAARILAEREAAAAEAKAKAEAKAAAEAAEARRKADEQAQLQAEVAAAKEAQMKAEAEAAAAKAKMEADAAAAQAKAKQDALSAQEAAAKAEAQRAKAAAEALRAQLLDQLNRVLATKDTPRGLVVTMADVLFDTGKYTIKQTTREALSRLAGIILAHPGLNLTIEGYTDNTGSEDFNQKLSQQRAVAVQSYLVEQGLAPSSISALGLGESNPVADNNTAAGRAKNRRVEIIVSGEAIGTKIGQQ